MTFPYGLSRLDLSPYAQVEQARSAGGFVWETEEADPYWTGRATTRKLSPLRLQHWEAFVAERVLLGQYVEFVDPVYYIPAAYRATGALPGGWNGLGTLGSISDPWTPVIAGLPVGLVLHPGDRLGIVRSGGGHKSYHMVRTNAATTPLTVSSATAQAVKLVPPVLPNVMAPGAQVVLLDPVVRLRIVANSWSASRAAVQDALGTFLVEEATVQ